MARRFDLHRSSNEFAHELASILNRTICTNVKINAILDSSTGFAVLGNGVTRSERAPRVGFPIHRTATCPTYMQVFMVLKPDRDGAYLMVKTSVIALALDEGMTQELLHYDYEREKDHGYPEAHVQICATSDHWQALGPDRALKKLHLPVGGRRFRPTLEDIVEFLIIEGFADGAPDWEKVISEGRDRFQTKQLRAAVRNYPEIALAQLRADGHIT